MGNGVQVTLEGFPSIIFSCKQQKSLLTWARWMICWKDPGMAPHFEEGIMTKPKDQQNPRPPQGPGHVMALLFTFPGPMTAGCHNRDNYLLCDLPERENDRDHLSQVVKALSVLTDEKFLAWAGSLVHSYAQGHKKKARKGLWESQINSPHRHHMPFLVI